jgi:hypothetical protein
MLVSELPFWGDHAGPDQASALSHLALAETPLARYGAPVRIYILTLGFDSCSAFTDIGVCRPMATASLHHELFRPPRRDSCSVPVAA